MTRLSEDRPGAVSGLRHSRRRTRPDGEVRARWAWTEPAVWTNRMLTALEHGVQGGNAFFSEHGLFSPVIAHCLVRQSSSR